MQALLNVFWIIGLILAGFFIELSQFESAGYGILFSMNESITIEPTSRPSAIISFLSGGKSGFFSGVVMSGILAALSPLLMGTPLGWSAAGLMIGAATLFGGVMSAKRAMFDTPHQPSANALNIVPVPVAMGVSGPVMSPEMVYADHAPAPSTAAKNWVADSGRSEVTGNRIQQILVDGRLSDRDRASAILASRDTADQQAGRA